MVTEVKIRLMIFFIFLSVYKTRISADRFSRVSLFGHFYQKISANAHFNSVFSNIRWFNRKTKNSVRFSFKKTRIFITFTDLGSKLSLEICQKIGGFDGKTEQNRLEVPTLTFFSKKPLYLLKNEKHSSIFYCKNKSTYKFYVFTKIFNFQFSMHLHVLRCP